MQHIYHIHQGAFVQPSAPDCQVGVALFEPCLSENESASADNAVLRDASLGAIPLVVLEAGRTMQQIPNWRESQDYQAGLSTNSRLIVADDSDHSIHWDRPAIVIDAVRAVIEAAHTGQSLAQ